MKTPLGNLEIQNVIDFLLIRKTGSSSSYYHDWIDASAQKNEAKILSNQLEEKDAHVDLTKFLSRFSGQRRQSMIITAGRPSLSGQQKINYILDLKIA